MKPQKVRSAPFLPGTRPCVLSQQHLGRCIRMQSVDGCRLSPARALMSGSWSPCPPPGGKAFGPLPGSPEASFQGLFPLRSPSLCPPCQYPPLL